MSSPASADPDRRSTLVAFAERIGHPFEDLEDLESAMRHRSWCAEHPGPPSNERLEFLGDAVLQLVVTQRLYVGAPDLPEGILAQRRAALVNTRVLAAAGRRVDLGGLLRLGRGEAATGGADKDSILADATEAVIGAVYLDAGLEAAASVVVALLEDDLERVEAGEDPGDPKSRLQEAAAKDLEAVPRYEVTDRGPDHAKEFSAVVRVGDRALGHGEGRTKKDAEQAAAAAALAELATGADSAEEGNRP